MQTLVETIGGFWYLFLLAAKTRFRLRGPYWKWRHETAFGTDRARMPSRRDRCRAIVGYARWVYRMKRGTAGRP